MATFLGFVIVAAIAFYGGRYFERREQLKARRVP